MKFERIPRDFLKEHHSHSTDVPSLYWHPNPFLRWLFYSRLEKIAQIIPTPTDKQVVCDFGGGGGAFLLTLSRNFQKVILLDFEITEAEAIVEHYNLNNVEIIKGDVLLNGLADHSLDVVIAADVLEHFQDVTKPVKEIARLLRPEGSFFLSGPTENFWYRLGRLLFGIQKPADHHHNVKEIERIFLKESFTIVKKLYLPLNISLFGIFCVFHAKPQSLK
ncbi:class I SAM-dependent methyltransferase [Patescibacteria group bacterium]|nr:class I SAM-dependent methyltransferase [Patescibacteria group bacterium]